jgi:signal transduction histidine kinase
VGVGAFPGDDKLDEIKGELAALSEHLRHRREAILQAWRNAIKRDLALTTSDSLPRVDLYDHIPALLSTFERELRSAQADEPGLGSSAGQESAAAHGLQRWQQGYDLREVTRELGKLNESVVAELDNYTNANPQISHSSIATARRLWAALCSMGIEESVGQYFQLQQQEAAGHVSDLESALVQIREMEQQRADIWQQAAHDLRGNLGVVANATVGLTHRGLRDASRDDFVRILMRNVTSLHHLLDDVTSLARLQAGREERRNEPMDASAVLQQLCEGIRPLAQQRRLFLDCSGPAGFAVDGDAVKIRRIAQNLVLNAVKYTVDGGITVSWGDSRADDPKRWEICIKDTGPGLPTASGQPMAHALEKAPEAPVEAAAPPAAPDPDLVRASPEKAGEGIGLSIVKRLCDMLDATIEMTSEQGVGTTFRILLPRKYTEPASNQS